MYPSWFIPKGLVSSPFFPFGLDFLEVRGLRSWSTTVGDTGNGSAVAKLVRVEYLARLTSEPAGGMHTQHKLAGLGFSDGGCEMSGTPQFKSI